MADIRINQLPLTGTPVAGDFLPLDNSSTRRATIQTVVEVGRPAASQAEAEAGANPTKVMTPLTTKQSIASEVGVTIASAASGALALTALQPSAIGVTVQAYDASLASIAGLTTSADQMTYTTGVDAYATTALTPFARSILDDADAAAVRATLILGNSAGLNVGTTAGTVAAGDDSRITGAAQKSANLSDLASASTARTNLGLGNSATRNVGTAAGTVAAGDDTRIVNAVQKTQLLSSGDLNNVVESGFYRLGDSALIANMPAALNFGQMLESRGNDTLAQIGIPYNGQPLQFRGASGIGGTPSFQSWQVIPREVDVAGPLGSTLSRPFLARDKEKPWSLEEFGNYGTTLTDHTALVQAALSSSDVATLLVPVGKTFNVNNTVTLSSKKNIIGGAGSRFLSRRTDRTFPMFIVGSGAVDSLIRDVIFDHNAAGVPEPSLANALSLALLSPLLVMADGVTIDNCQVLNSWDNGLGIGLFSFTGDGSAGSPYSTTQTNGSPKGVRVRGSYAYNCGIGDHVTGTAGRIGVGFNALTGSQVMFESCRANFCHTGFATDFGGGAGAIFTNCISIAARQNAAGTNGGNGFYLADGPVCLSGCQSLFGDGIGFEIPKEANGVSLSSCYSFANKKQGFLVGSSYTMLSACVSQEDSFGNPNTYDAFFLNPYAENMVGVQLMGCMAFGTQHRYGWASNAGASFTCDAAVIGGYFNGVSGEGNAAGKNIAYQSSLQKRLRMNPLGGMLEILGSWDNPLKTATSYIFVDDVNRLRIKSGSAPTSVTDGTIVGTQS